MIEYDPHHWSSHLFDIKGSMVGEIWLRVTACTVWAAAVVLVDLALTRYWGRSLGISDTAHSLIGVALGLLLVFRTNTSYDRFWEARKLWGSITNESRNLVRAAGSFLNQDRALVERLTLWTAAFPWTVMNRLSGRPQALGPAGAELPSAEVEAVLKADHVPLAVSRKMTGLLAEAGRKGLVTDFVVMTLDQNVQQLVDYLGACERIHTTSMPYAYVVHLRRALIIYCVTLPFALVGKFAWVTVPVTMILSYVMFGVEEIGVEIEDPFDDDPNSLPLERICQNIERNVRGVFADVDREISG